MATALTLATQARRVKTQDPSNIYASAFRRRRHYVFGLSVRPSVRSLKYPLLTCKWVRWSTQPTVTVFTACPSVRPSVYINGSVVLGADESPWPCGTPSWYTPLSWMILSKQKNLHLYSSQYICVFSKMSVRPSIWRGFRAVAGECIEGLAWNFTCWCTFTIFRND